jgi:hypothetical protein
MHRIYASKHLREDAHSPSWPNRLVTIIINTVKMYMGWRAQMTVTLEEEVDCGGETEKTIRVGNVTINEVNTNGDFTIEPLPKPAIDQGWSITTSDGKLAMPVPGKL